MNIYFLKTIFYTIFLMLYINSYGPIAVAGESINSADIHSLPEAKIYTIYHISVDETASTSRKASQNARRKAQRMAFQHLLRKIIRQEDQENLSEPDDRQIADLVSGIEIANEKTSHIRYIADYTVHFSRDKMYNFLLTRKIPFAETLSEPVNILTVLEEGGAAVLWEKQNAWRKAWQSYDTVNNLVPVRVILPTLKHRMALNQWQAQAGKRSQLQLFAAEFGLNNLYVMSLGVERDIGRKAMILTLNIYSDKEDIAVYNETIIVADAAQEQNNIYDEAIRQATYWLDNQWKEKVIIHFGASSHINVMIKYDQRDDWFAIKEKLESISLIRKMTYRNFKITAVDMELEHSGDVAQIILALAQQELILEKQDENITGYPWRLTLKK